MTDRVIPALRLVWSRPDKDPSVSVADTCASPAASPNADAFAIRPWGYQTTADLFLSAIAVRTKAARLAYGSPMEGDLSGPGVA